MKKYYQSEKWKHHSKKKSKKNRLKEERLLTKQIKVFQE
jgi:hypothetical protein